MPVRSRPYRSSVTTSSLTQVRSAARVKALDSAAMLAILQGDYARAEAFLGESLALARELGISRQTFYVYERRFRDGALAGLLPRPRAPYRHPNQTPVQVADRIECWWRELAQGGLDHGARHHLPTGNHRAQTCRQ